MGWLKTVVQGWLNIQESPPVSVNIVEPFSYELNVFKNELWYRGDPSELHQFYSTTDDCMENTSFWAARSSTGVSFRKIHSGLPSLIVDVLVDIIVTDMIDIKIDNTEAQKRWDAIAKDTAFDDVLKEAVRDVLVQGDGAFKISYDPDLTEYPIIEFMAGERVRYVYKRGRLEEIHFITKITNTSKGWGSNKFWVLDETYSNAGVTYTLYDDQGKEASLAEVEELSDLKSVANPNKFPLAQQFMLMESAKWQGRGKSIYDAKGGSFDAFDECVSQWVEAMRDGRTNKYIPKTLLPQNPITGQTLPPNPFDNRYMQTGADMQEDGVNQIKVVSGNIPHDGLLASYTTLLDLCIQGLVSPSTLGIDVKKLDNAEAQREKEKATLYTRNKIIDQLNKVLPSLINNVLKADDMFHNRVPGEYKTTISFGEYANPSFEAQVETIGKARTQQIMSIERAVEELYGSGMTDEDKALEVARLKSELGITELPDDDETQELNRVLTTQAAQAGNITTEKGTPSQPGDVMQSAEEATGKSLNGAQTQSLITILGQLSAGVLTEGQAVNIISVAIGVSKDEALKIIKGAA